MNHTAIRVLFRVRVGNQGTKGTGAGVGPLVFNASLAFQYVGGRFVEELGILFGKALHCLVSHESHVGRLQRGAAQECQGKADSGDSWCAHGGLLEECQ